MSGTISLSNFRDIGKLESTTADRNLFIILWAITTVLWILVFLNYDPTLATLYLFLHFGAGILFLMQGRKTSMSYGNYDDALKYVIGGGLVGAVFTFIIASVYPQQFALIAPFAVVTPLPSAFLLTIQSLVFATSAILLIGVVQPIIEEHFIAFLAGLTANYLGAGSQSVFKIVVGVFISILIVFVLIHVASYTQTIDRYYSDYQNARIYQTGQCTTAGYYFEPKIAACRIIPPAPNTAQANNALLGMLLWVGSFRVAMTALGILTNSLWAMIIAHGVHNSIVTAFIVIQQPVFAVFGIVALMILFGLWLLTAPKKSEATAITEPSWGVT